MKYLLTAAFCILFFDAKAQKSSIHIVGAMKNVMWKGQLHGMINLDTISKKEGLYGLGPVEGLTGELLIINGKSYRSTVLSKEEMKVEETFKARAPFFVYGYVSQFAEYSLPANTNNLQDIEMFLEQTKYADKPFIFVIKGRIKKASINLPVGTTVSSPDEAHQGQVSYSIEDKQVEIVGFFSRNHQSVFTHYDTFMHLHLITKDGTMMGHLDTIEFNSGEVKLYLPIN